MLDMTVPEVQQAYQALANALAADGVDVLVNPAAWFLVERDKTTEVLRLEVETVEQHLECQRRIDELQTRQWLRDGQIYTFWKLDEMAVELNAFANYPPLTAWIGWLCRAVIPAMRRHGYYNPATGHEPPPSSLLNAIECREAGRDVMRRFNLEDGDA